MEKNKLNISYLDLYKAAQDAININNNYRKKEILSWIMNNSDEEDKRQVEYILRRCIPNLTVMPLKDIDDNDVCININAYKSIYFNKIQNCNSYNVNINSIDMLEYIKTNALGENAVIFESQKNEINIDKRKLNVRGLLDVIGYALDIMKIVDIKGVEKYKNGVMVLKAIDRVIDNSKQNEEKDIETILRNTGFGIEVLSKVLEQVIENEKTRKYVQVSSMSIRLVLDFLQYK